MNPGLQKLVDYPFIRWAKLLDGRSGPDSLEPIRWSIGEPQHAVPELVTRALIEHLAGVGNYPATRGLPELREAMAAWLGRRIGAPGSVDAATQILPCNGTREALFAVAQVLLEAGDVCGMPNPFYQIYEGATLLAGATPHYLPCLAENGFIPDLNAVPDSVLKRMKMLYICSPGNPTGAVLSMEQLKEAILLAQQYDFVLCSDECYSEIYFDSKPPLLMQACHELGIDDYNNCLVFHSLSKRSNLPGLRSGFIAGDAKLIEPLFNYRTYHGSAMPLHHQHASIAAWSDEDHVIENRKLYQAKFDAVLPELQSHWELQKPSAAFYLWSKIPEQFGDDDVEFALQLYLKQHVQVLPGRFLSREIDGVNPGKGYVRMALVADQQRCLEACERIKTFLN